MVWRVTLVLGDRRLTPAELDLEYYWVAEEGCCQTELDRLVGEQEERASF